MAGGGARPGCPGRPANLAGSRRGRRLRPRTSGAVQRADAQSGRPHLTGALLPRRGESGIESWRLIGWARWVRRCRHALSGGGPATAGDHRRAAEPHSSGDHPGHMQVGARREGMQECHRPGQVGQPVHAPARPGIRAGPGRGWLSGPRRRGRRRGCRGRWRAAVAGRERQDGGRPADRDERVEDRGERRAGPGSATANRASVRCTSANDEPRPAAGGPSPARAATPSTMTGGEQDQHGQATGPGDEPQALEPAATVALAHRRPARFRQGPRGGMAGRGQRPGHTVTPGQPPRS